MNDFQNLEVKYMYNAPTFFKKKYLKKMQITFNSVQVN